MGINDDVIVIMRIIVIEPMVLSIAVVWFYQ